MKRINTGLFLFTFAIFGLIFVIGCSTDEAVEKPGGDVPPVEIELPEELAEELEEIAEEALEEVIEEPTPAVAAPTPVPKPDIEVIPAPTEPKTTDEGDKEFGKAEEPKSAENTQVPAPAGYAAATPKSEPKSVPPSPTSGPDGRPAPKVTPELTKAQQIENLYREGRALLEEGEVAAAEANYQKMRRMEPTAPFTLILGNMIQKIKAAGPDAIVGRQNLLDKVEEARQAEKAGDPRKAQLIYLQVERSPHRQLLPPAIREEVAASRKRLNRQLGTISHGGPQPDSALNTKPATVELVKPQAILDAANPTLTRQLAATKPNSTQAFTYAVRTQIKAKPENTQPVDALILWVPLSEDIPPVEKLANLTPGEQWNLSFSIEDQTKGTLSIALILPELKEGEEFTDQVEFYHGKIVALPQD